MIIHRHFMACEYVMKDSYLVGISLLPFLTLTEITSRFAQKPCRLSSLPVCPNHIAQHEGDNRDCKGWRQYCY